MRGSASESPLPGEAKHYVPRLVWGEMWIDEQLKRFSGKVTKPIGIGGHSVGTPLGYSLSTLLWMLTLQPILSVSQPEQVQTNFFQRPARDSDNYAADILFP